MRIPSSLAKNIPGGTLLLLIFSLLALLSGCQESAAPVPPPTATPLTFVWMSDLLANSTPAQDQSVTTIGYILVDQSGASLVDAIVFDANGTPQPLETGTAPLWLGTDARAHYQGSLRTAGKLEYASVVAQARLNGPGSYGPGGQYRYQLANLTLQPLTAQETTIADLIDRPAAYENQLVRLVGGLLIRKTSGLLVDKLGPGGIPAPKSRQLKLRTPISDQAFLSRLKSAPSGAVRFGQIQIEGLWRNGALNPLSITVTT